MNRLAANRAKALISKAAGVNDRSQSPLTAGALCACLALWISVLYAAISPIWALGTGQSAARAQTPAPEDWTVTIGQFDASKYPEITLYLNVADGAGRQVTDLKQEDFFITEDGRAVAITGFAGLSENRPVDIVFVFDTTASMAEEIAGVVRTSLAFADELERKGRDYRLGLVTFSDAVLQVNRPDLSLTDHASEFKEWVSKLVADGGDGEPENDYAAIHRAIEMNFRPQAQIVLILITDAPVHRYGDPPDGGAAFDDPNLDLKPTLDRLKAKGASVYAVAPAFAEFTSLASETGGRFYDIHQNPDFISLINEIGQTLANQYRITYRSPRPTYDGTRRNVQVLVGGAQARKIYAEQHLLNVQSNCLVGLLCLLPLMFALVAPMAGRIAWRWIQPTSPASQATPNFNGEKAVLPAAIATNVAPVGGEGIGQPPAPEENPMSCPNCGQAARPGARFCSRCGARL